MIIDWNRTTLEYGQVFHFANSLRPFVEVKSADGDTLFLDINQMIVYNFDELEYEGLEFYHQEDDDDFQGVEIDGYVTWMDD